MKELRFWHPAGKAACLLVLLCTIGCAGRSASQWTNHAVHPERPAFTARVVPLLDGTRSAALVEVEIPYRELSFRRVGDELAARFDIIVLIFDGERQVAGNLYPETMHAPDRASLEERPLYKRDMRIPVPPGRYRLEVAVSEPSSGHEGRVELGLALEPVFPGQLRLSPLLFGPCNAVGTIEELFFDPRMASDASVAGDSLCVHAELLHPDLTPGNVEVHWSLWDEQESRVLVREGSFSVSGGRESTRLSWPISFADLSLGGYRLEVEAEADGRKAGAFANVGSRVETDEALARFFDESIGALEYIADEAEVDVLREADPSARRRLWDAFWGQRDPSPMTARNEFKEEFFDRLRIANARYAAVRPGWRTDRGRIYIQYGEPDLVDRRPMPSSGRPVEIWQYDRLARRFVFVDRTGFGDYSLIE